MSPWAAAVQMSGGLVSCASREADAAMKKMQQPTIKLVDSLTRRRRLPKLPNQGERGNRRQKKSENGLTHPELGLTVPQRLFG